MNRRAFARSLVALSAVPGALRAAGSAAAVDGPGPASAGPGEMPMARGNPAHTGEQPGPGPRGSPIVRWRFTTNAPIASSPAVAGGRVFVGSDDGFLFAVKVDEGTAVWAVGIGDRVRGTPAVRDGRVFVANGTFNIVDAVSGVHLARLDSSRSQLTSSLVPSDAPSLGPTIFGAGMRGSSGFIEARDPRDRRIHWRHDVVNHMTTAPAVAGGAVYAGTLAGELLALDAAGGERRWRLATVGGIYAAPAVAGGVVYVTSWAPAPGQRGAVVPNASGALYAVDTETGQPLWQAVTGSPVESGPAVGGGTVVVGGGDSVFAFEAATGAPRWQFETGAFVRSSPAIAEDVVYVGSGDGHLYALDLASGVRRWSLSVGAPLDTAPAVVDGVVYVTCGKALVAVGGL